MKEILQYFNVKLYLNKYVDIYNLSTIRHANMSCVHTKIILHCLPNNSEISATKKGFLRPPVRWQQTAKVKLLLEDLRRKRRNPSFKR